MKDIIRDEKGEPVFVPYRRCKEYRTVFHDDEGYEMSASMFRDENGKKLYGWDASDYENSDLRKFVEAWAEEKGMKFECGYPLRGVRRGGYDEEL